MSKTSVLKIILTESQIISHIQIAATNGYAEVNDDWNDDDDVDDADHRDDDGNDDDMIIILQNLISCILLFHSKQFEFNKFLSVSSS